MNVLTIENFKCLEQVTIPIRNLTLLAGQNGSGKSTAIQALLLLRQSFSLGNLQAGRLSLNGSLVNIGSAQDAISEGAVHETIAFALGDEESSSRWSFDYSTAGTDALPLVEESVDPRAYDDALFRDSFCYLQTERLGPRLYGTVADHAVRIARQIGERGEFTAFFLNVFAHEEVKSLAVRHKDAKSSTLLAQTEAWLDEICPGVRISTAAQENIDLVRYTYSFEGPQGVSNSFRPTNVGFGVTYALPIIVAALSMQVGGFLIVETPEAHLHPRGQSKVAELLVRLASSGVKVLIETHSDHLLNGVRIAVRRKMIAADQVSIVYFDKPKRAARTTVTNISVDVAGHLDTWPSGFFDEYENALLDLL